MAGALNLNKDDINMNLSAIGSKGKTSSVGSEKTTFCKYFGNCMFRKKGNKKKRIKTLTPK